MSELTVFQAILLGAFCMIGLLVAGALIGVLGARSLRRRPPTRDEKE